MSDRNQLQEVETAWGPVRYWDVGSGQPVVLVHGLLVNGELWQEAVDRLVPRARCITVELPMGAHAAPVGDPHRLTLRAQAEAVAALLDALALEKVILVGNDTGGAVCQLVMAHHPARLAAAVLTSCDTGKHVPPASLRPLLWLARSEPAFAATLALLRTRLGSKGLASTLAHRWEPDLFGRFLAPSRRREIRGDLAVFLTSLPTRALLEAHDGLRSFDQPVVVAWAADDRLYFPTRHGQRLAATFPDGRFVPVPRSRAFVPLDRPDELVRLVDNLLATPTEA